MNIGKLGIKEGIWSERLLGIRKTVEEIGKDLPPQDDWTPVVLVEGTFPADMTKIDPTFDPALINKTGLLVIGFAGDFMGSDTGKDFAAMAMYALAVKTKATAMTFISTIWMSIAKTEEMPPVPENETDEEARERLMQWAQSQPKPSQDPDRTEKLMLLSVAYGGEDDGHKTAFADIVRSPDKPPRLVNWRLFDDPDSNWAGRFPDAIYEGLKLAGKNRAKEENQ